MKERVISRGMKRNLLIWINLLGAATGIGAPTTNHLSIEELRQRQLPEIVLESVTHVESDKSKRQTGGFVEVKGVIGGHIRFELLLPDDWNGRFVMGGGGGFVGTVQNAARGSVNQGYATVGTDTGHQSESGYMGGWALDNLEAKVNFGYLAVHRT